MHVILYVLLAATCTFADESEDRRSKLPYIADAVGNSLPPPSNVPATVGSPVNLLTPDRYEFYTFDESGELVKRLMTLEEIQAIVAAGEETEGLVTFANENQPTVAFNFSQPSHTKVHSVVTNVQNVLKAQMEAHKNKPNIRPTLDTPDVSDSWSLILPSIFGNSGIDIVPDRNTESYIPPETETLEIENSQSKENNRISDTSPSEHDEINEIPVKQIATTNKPILMTKPNVIPSTTTSKPSSTTTVIPTISTTKLAVTTTTKKLPSTPVSTTKTTTITTTNKPIVTSTRKNKPTKLTTTTAPKTSTTSKSSVNKSNSNDILVTNHKISVANNTSQFEKINTYVPVTSSIKPLVTKLTTHYIKYPITSTESFVSTTISPSNLHTVYKINNTIVTTSSYAIPSNKDQEELEKFNSTTLTTQSISPTYSMTTTEIVPTKDNTSSSQTIEEFNGNNKDDESLLPLFDVAQSISQIASDLGNEYNPIPSSTQESDKNTNIPVESKESLEIDIPTDSGSENDTQLLNDNKYENFVKISTIDPQQNPKNKLSVNEVVKSEEETLITTISTKTSTDAPLHSSSTSVSITSLPNNVIDPNLSESIDDMMSQVINQNLADEYEINKNNKSEKNMTTTTTIQTPDSVSKSDSLTNTINLTTRHNLEIESITTLKPQNIEINDNFTLTPISNKNQSKENQSQTYISVDNNNSSDQIKISLNKFLPINENYSVNNDSKKNDSNFHHELPNISNDTKISNSSALSNKSESTTSSFFLTTSYSSNMSLDYNKITTKKYENLNHTKNKEDFKKKVQKVNLDEKEIANERNNSWKLIPTVPLPKTPEGENNESFVQKTESLNNIENNADKLITLDFSKENQGLEVTTKDLGEDILQFTELCNELAFKYWQEIVQRNIDSRRSFVLSPYAITSMLAMMFMGAKGATSGEMNEILKLDDMVTFNPHFTLKNISDSIETSSSSGVAISAFIRELYSDRSKGKVLTFYKERAQHFYNGHVEEINFKLISDVIRRRTNLLVKRYTWGKITEYIKSNSISMHPPLAAFSANIFETDCTGTSVDGRDGEMYFVVSPTVRQRRLVPVPAVVYKSNFLAGYDPVLDATAAALGNTNSIISTLFLMPGQQGNIVHAEDLEALEKRLLDSKPNTQAWNSLLRTLLPRVGLQLQIPRFSHKSIFNISSTLKKMGLKELFDAEHADLGGMNGPSKDLYLSDMIQLNTFVTCGEGLVGEQHHIEEYPELLQARRRNSRWATIWNEPRDYQRAFHDPHDVGEAMNLPLHLRPRQARLPSRSTQPARLKFDRPFLYFVRHNPSGMILYVGRYNPRLLP